MLDHAGYNSLLAIKEADEALTNRQDWFKKTAPLLSREELQRKFNLCLVHKHVVLQPGERMVATGLVTQPEIISESTPSDIIPSSWTATGVPFEWKRVNTTEEIIPPPPAEFFREFSEIVGDGSVLGLSLAHDPAPEGQIWCERTDYEQRQHILEIKPVEGPWGDRNNVHHTSWSLEPSTDEGDPRLVLKLALNCVCWGH